MAQNPKKYKKQNSPATVSETRKLPPEIIEDSTPAVINDNSLIIFDKKTKIFLLGLIALYLIVSSLKLHTSSIGNWDILFQKETESVIAGTPKYIRSDEWLVTEPQLIGQNLQGKPLSNAAVGGGNAPVIWSFPIKDFTMLLRPNLWPYFLVDLEHAFSFSWNFNIFFFLISTFLLLKLLTRNSFWLSVTGTFFIFLSSGLQWWSYLIGSEMIYMTGVLISFVYLLYGKKTSSILIAGIFLVFSCYGVITAIYPAFQIPLIYLYLFIILGFLIQRNNFKSTLEKWPIKAGVLLGALIIFGVFALHYYEIAKDTFTLMMNTVYPGKRIGNGGELISGKLFSEFFGMFLIDTHTPEKWWNVCEASGFLMFFPVIFYSMGYQFFKTKKMDALEIALSIYLLIGLSYVLVGFPPFLSKATLFSMSTDYRALPIVELGNCILLFCFLGNKKTTVAPKFSWLEFGLLAVAIIIFIRLVTSNINKATNNFFTDEQVAIVTLLVTVTYLLVRYRHLKFATPVLCFLLLAMNISHAGVHPLVSGLGSLLENPLVQLTSKVYQKDPRARWIVFGDQNTANLLKTSGINVFNGIKMVPNLKEMTPLDPLKQYDSMYNRYAHVAVKMYIDWKDSVWFNQSFVDSYTIFMDPCSPRFKEMGIKYVLFTYKPQSEELRCMTPIDTTRFFLYKRSDL